MTRIGKSDLTSQAGLIAEQVRARAEETRDAPAEVYARAVADTDPNLAPIRDARMQLAEAVAEYNRLRGAGEPALSADELMLTMLETTKTSVVNVDQAPRGETNGPELLSRIRTEIAKAVVGQDAAVESLLIGLLTGGHVLLEGPKGVAKTLLAKSFAAVSGLDFKRQQFTPDMMPGDITGSPMPDPSGKLTPVFGPIVTEVYFADEINRAPPRVQAALLEAMEERQVSMLGQSKRLPELFFVVATENPDSHVGTFPLPDVNIDRFMKRIDIVRPSRDQRRELIDLEADGRVDVKPVASREELLAVRDQIRKVNLDSVARDYIADLVEATITDRTHVDLVKTAVDEGASERATVALVRAARAHAFLQGRDYVLTQDIDAVAPPILRHRLPIVSGSDATSDQVVAQILREIQSRG